MTWEQGLELCTQHDMDFVTFDSAEEASYFRALRSFQVWVGINDFVEEGVFRNYKTGKDIGNFLSWYPGEPNRNGKCVESGDGYNDNNCEASRHVGCEMKY
jgi:Lectin C-type domain